MNMILLDEIADRPSLDSLRSRAEDWADLACAIGFDAAADIMETGRDFTDDELREIQNYRSACEFAGRAL